MNTWSSEVVVAVARRPSWIARKSASTRPPAATPPVAASLPPAEPSEPVETAYREELTQIEEPGPLPLATPSVDLVTSAALAQLADENAALREQVAEMASTMARLRRQVLEASEGELVKLAIAIAERVVARELAISPELVVAWAREAVETLAAKDEVVIAFAKDVAEQVPTVAWTGVGVEHQLITEPQFPNGAIEVRTPHGILAVDADARLAAVSHALGVVKP